MSLKNVVIVSDYAYTEGGATNVAIQTALLLSKFTTYNVYFFSGCGEICSELKSSKVNSVSLNIQDILHNPSRLSAIKNGIYNKYVEREFRKYLSDLLPSETIIHIHTWTKVLSSAIFKVSNTLGFKVVVSLHDYFITCPNGGCINYKKNRICTLKPLSLKCLCSNCDSRNYLHKIWRVIRQFKQNSVISKCNNISYVFVSEFQKREILRRTSLFGNKYMLVNCINENVKERVLAENNELFIFIGRVSNEKGINLFCEAVTQAGVKAVVIGDGNLKAKLEDTYPNIKFTGWLNKNEISKWISKSRCMVFPSLWYECCPLTILEARSYGLPCIASSITAAKEFIVSNETGLLCEPNLHNLIAAINTLKDNEFAKRVSLKFFNSFEKDQNAEKCYESKLVSIYNDFIFD